MCFKHATEPKCFSFLEKRKSFQLDLEEALSPPPISLSAPELSSRCVMPFKALRCAVSSTELLHERAMARFYKAVALEEEQTKQKQSTTPRTPERNNIPKYSSQVHEEPPAPPVRGPLLAKTPNIFIKTDSVEDKEYRYNSRQASHDSEASENKWHMSFDEDYTASTVSTDGEYSEEEEGSLNGDVDRSEYTNDEDTYNPRDKIVRPSPVNEDIEEEESDREIPKPLPLPDPNFIPKPILKRRESDTKEPKLSQDDDIPKTEEKETFDEKPKKGDRMTLFKKFTKMPVQKPFPFPKILNKKEPKKAQEDNQKLPLEIPKISQTKKEEEKLDKISEEGRTVIDYYGSIVKEYGGQKRPTTPLYLKTEDLKAVAEKQQLEKKGKEDQKKKNSKSKKSIAHKVTANKLTVANDKTPNSINKPTKSKQSQKLDKCKPQSNDKRVSKINDKESNPSKKHIQQIVLKTTERATIVIPIDYKELEEKAKMNVRSAIDYMVDMCLLMLAFWVYLFKDERLAIPFLILIIYRQLQETLLMDIPEWVKNHTPSWLKKKTS